MGTLPKWATELIAQVALDTGRDASSLELWWRRSHVQGRTGTTGITKWGTRNGAPATLISITAAGKRRGQKLTLLHEIAHWLCGKDEEHGPLFWDTAWRLYRRYGVPIGFARMMERQYRKGSEAAYKRTRGGREQMT